MLVIFLLLGLVASSQSLFLSNETGPALVQSKRAIAPRALSGSKTSIYSTGYKLHLEWKGTQNPSSLTTTVTVTFYIELLSTSYNMYNQYPSGDNAPKLTITIDGSTVLNEVKTFDFRDKAVGYTDARGSSSKAVSHDSYGSAKSISISASLNTQISKHGTISISDTASLDAVPVSVTVKFNGNGGTASKSSMTVTYKKTYGTLATASRTGYTHSGWFTATSGGTKITSSSTVSVIGTQNLYAQWTANPYTVNFNGNGGTPSKSSMTVTYASQYGTLPTASRTGYTHKGWFTATSGGTQITSGSTVSITATQTLYAQWTANPYTVNFNGNGGTPSKSSMTVTYDSKYGTLPTATRTGYGFKGWFTATSGGTQITSESTVSITATQTLYAQWSINFITITFTNPGGPEVEPIHQDYGTEITLPVPSKAGHTFINWLDENDVVFTANKMPAESITLHPLYSVNNYTIFVHIDGGVTVLEEPYETVIDLPVPTVTPKGHTFGGWEDLDGANYTDVYTVYNDDNLTSIWILNFYTVTFVVGSEQSTSASVGYGMAIEPPEVEKAGYSFMGWCLGEENCTKVMDLATETMPTMDIVMYPKWELVTRYVEVVLDSKDIDEWKKRIIKLVEDTTNDYSIAAFVDDGKVHIILEFVDESQSEAFYRACTDYVRDEGSVRYVSSFEGNGALGCSLLSEMMMVALLMMFYSIIF